MPHAAHLTVNEERFTEETNSDLTLPSVWPPAQSITHVSQILPITVRVATSESGGSRRNTSFIFEPRARNANRVTFEDRIRNALGTLSEEGVEIHDAGLVRDYLLEHPNLIPHVEQFGLFVKQRFSPDVKVSLQYHFDPEEEDDHLDVIARRSSYDDEFLDQIEKIREAYAPAFNAGEEWIHLTTDFRPSNP
ncbi:hypothetical protein HY256_10840 [Candidatus Sumerlaeota bacterium]|nr:hypothetical protein [Candidatus Sumerlaeota bacterium]